MSRYISPFILPSINEVCQYPLLKSSPKPWCFHPKLNCWYGVLGVVGSAISSPNMVCRMTAKKFNFAFIWPYYSLPIIHRLSKCSFANFNRASTCFLFSNGVLRGERAWMPWRFSALLIVSLKQQYLLMQGLPEVLPEWFLALGELSWLFFGLLGQGSYVEHWSWPVYGELMLFPFPDNGPHSAHRNIQHLEMRL